MNATLIIVGVGVMLLVALLVTSLRHRHQISSMSDFEQRWKQVDMAAFLNLVDPGEERYLRRNLPAGEFRRLQRERIQVMWEYLSRLAANSKLMVQAGQIVQHSGAGEAVVKANQLVASAMQMRMLIFMAEGYLLVRFVMPLTSNPIESLVRRYETLTQTFAQTWTEQQLARSNSMAS